MKWRQILLACAASAIALPAFGAPVLVWDDFLSAGVDGWARASGYDDQGQNYQFDEHSGSVSFPGNPIPLGLSVPAATSYSSTYASGAVHSNRLDAGVSATANTHEEQEWNMAAGAIGAAVRRTFHLEGGSGLVTYTLPITMTGMFWDAAHDPSAVGGSWSAGIDGLWSISGSDQADDAGFNINRMLSFTGDLVYGQSYTFGAELSIQTAITGYHHTSIGSYSMILPDAPLDPVPEPAAARLLAAGLAAAILVGVAGRRNRS